MFLFYTLLPACHSKYCCPDNALAARQGLCSQQEVLALYSGCQAWGWVFSQGIWTGARLGNSLGPAQLSQIAYP